MAPRVARVIAALSAFALIATGCTPEEVPDGSASPTPTDTGAATAPTTSEPSPGSPPTTFAEDDAVLDVAVEEPSTLDPMRIQDPGSYLVARQLFEGLTRYDPADQSAAPAAAASWRATDGGRTFVFSLQPGLTFHDGSPVTAGDFVYAFDRLAQKRNASELAYTLEKVRGFNAVNRAGTTDHMAGLRAVDDTTLAIELSEPYYDFPMVLTHPALVPLPRGIVDDFDRFLSEPVGNGPFEIAEPWSPGRPVVLRAFDGFPRTPGVDGVRFVPFVDVATSWIPFVEGELDIAQVPVGQFLAAETVFGDRGYSPLLSGYYYGFNLDSPALRDRRLRTAINRAIDRAAISEEIFGGTLVPPRGIVPTAMPGFEENVCLALCNHAPRSAARLVARLPRAKRRVQIDYTAGTPHAQVAGAVAEDLEGIGLSVQVRAFGINRYLERLRRGQMSVYRLGWIADYPVADEFLSSLFGSGSGDNHSGFASGAVDRLLARAHRQPSDDLRRDLYLQAEKTILRAVPIVPIGSFLNHWAAQPEVQGVVFDAVGGFDAVDVSLDPAA